MYQRIMVPLDGSELAQTALSHAMALCKALGATLILLHVRERGSGIEASERYLDYMTRQLASNNVAIEIALREGAVAEAIVHAAESERIDVIAMATHGRSGVQRMVYGIVAEQVLRNAHTPVLLVRVPAAQLS